MSNRQNIVISKYGPAKRLSVTEAPWDAALAPDEVSIDVAYSGINFADIQMRLGFYPDAPKRPFVPGYEVSGVVDRVGKDVQDLVPGDRVVAGTYFGGYGSKGAVPRRQVLSLPEPITLEEGAALPVNFFTAHLALFEMARVREGDKVLIECATGGVGTLAVQLARQAGAEVMGLTTSADKLDYITALGAVAMTRERFDADPTQRGFDFILNASGGAAINTQRARLGLTGRMVCMGLNSGVKNGKRSFLRLGLAALRTPRVGIIKLMNANSGIYGLNALKVLEDETWVQRLVAAFERVDHRQLRPHVDRVFDAEHVSDAHTYIQTKQARGKILLAWPGH